jgi:hypothetical protein
MDDSIRHLASRLAENKLRKDRWSIGHDQDRAESGRRIVALVGAGASHAVAGLPLGREFAASLVEQLKCDAGDDKILFARWLRHMEAEFGFAREDFKTILFSLHQIKGGALVRLVQDSLSIASAEQGAYQHIARFLANGHLDAIVNFNFDELLDAAIASELQEPSRLWRIYSEPTCTACFPDGAPEGAKLNRPLYIKPHGTISQGSSLRFARPDFHRIEPLQRALLEQLFGVEPLTIVVVGFRLKFFEFSQLISEVLAPGSEIIIVDKHEDILDSSLLKFYDGVFLKVTDEDPLEDILHRAFVVATRICGEIEPLHSETVLANHVPQKFRKAVMDALSGHHEGTGVSRVRLERHPAAR